MPRHYPPDRKADALQRLQDNGGDILTTHVQTGIPQRTLYNWRTELWLQQVLRRQTLPPSPQKEIPAFADETDGLLALRREIITLLFELSKTPDFNTPFRLVDRIRAQARLVDSLISLNVFLAPYLRESESETPSPLANWSHWDTLEDPTSEFTP